MHIYDEMDHLTRHWNEEPITTQGNRIKGGMVRLRHLLTVGLRGANTDSKINALWDDLQKEIKHVKKVIK